MAIGVDRVEDVDFEIIWEGQPAGLFDRFLSLIHLNFTRYQVTKDELIIQKGFLNRKTNSVELYLLKDPDLTESLYQRIIGVGTLTVKVDTNTAVEGKIKVMVLKNIKDCLKIRKLLRDNIERDVSERKITYFDRV